MKYFKITKTWTVKVKDEESEEVAIKLVAADPDTYLDSSTVTRTEYKQRPQQQKSGNGWVTAAKDQLLGSNSRQSR